MAGQPLNRFEVILYEGTVSTVYAPFPILYVEVIRDALIAKFGKPKVMKQNVSNGYGATFSKEIYVWADGAERDLVLHTFGDTADFAFLRLTHVPTLSKEEKDAKARAAELSDDL